MCAVPASTKQGVDVTLSVYTKLCKGLGSRVWTIILPVNSPGMKALLL